MFSLAFSKTAMFQSSPPQRPFMEELWIEMTGSQ